ncbi:hypothetical protein SAMN04515617_12536 [Collimonas sp. OK242]|jgi:hypothetical protein|uniref:DUF2076 domain-containing protein n=1 Tax=Collimonas sp. OK242 TaxID=1798195 RepID=UPI00089B033C|nr:DUF2076 domain-containing protein [Collimonas sp. OK242]SDY85990.1 hypothetical protein SAMN04515617_12536 [Collimonas sp. OK242]
MSPQETQSLQDFLNQLTQVRGIAKDPQADALIASAVAQQPDAAYLLVQRALLMEQALNTAKTQIASLQSQIQATQTAPSRSFFDPNAWGNTSATASRPAAPPMMASMPAAMQVPLMQSPAPAASPGFFGGGVGSALGTVAATAAGVAGGAFLFQGIEHLMHPGSGAGFMNQAGMAPSTTSTENNTVNNYYGADTAKDDSTSTDDVAADDTSGDDDSSLI